MRTLAARTASRASRRRRGAITLFAVFLLVIGVVAIAVVVNYTFAYMAQLDLQRRSAILARAGVVELLDENVLTDQPINQLDDLLAAENVVLDYLAANNAVTPERLRLTADNLNLAAGHVSDVTAPVLSVAGPLNSLSVELERHSSGANPLGLLVTGMGGPDTVDIRHHSVATLDSRLVGFRPTPDVAAPVAPLAIESDAWFLDRVAAMNDTNGNGRLELFVTLLDTAGGGLASGALVDFDGSVPLEHSDLPSQITDGILPPGFGSGTDDLAGSLLGPATAGSPLPLPATRTSTADTASLVAAFNTLAASSDPLRAFPIYASGYSDPLAIVGFIGARVLGASDTGSGGEHQLTVQLEPEFIVHFTAETDPSQPENPYVHKVRITQ